MISAQCVGFVLADSYERSAAASCHASSTHRELNRQVAANTIPPLRAHLASARFDYNGMGASKFGDLVSVAFPTMAKVTA